MSSVKEKRKKVKKIRLLGKNFSKGIMIYGLVINILVGLSAIYYSSAIVFSTNSCISFENALTNETAFNDLSLTNSDLLDPIQKCTSSANTHFL